MNFPPAAPRHPDVYRVCGLALESEIPLPGVPLVPDAGSPDVCIRLGETPDSLASPQKCGPAYEAGADELLLKVPNIGRYFVRGGREIIIEPEPTAGEAELRIFLMGSAFGALLHQRGLLPLHASCVRVDGGCVAFAGHSGAGKSTLAAYLRQQGYDVLTDDVCPVRILPEAGVVALPGFPRLKLWAESLRALGMNPEDYPQPRSKIEKYEVLAANVTAEHYLPLKALYVLRETRDRDPEGIEPVSGIARLRTLLANTYRFAYLDGLGRKGAHFQMAAGIVSQVPIYSLWRRRDLSRFAETTSWLEDHWRSLLEDNVIATVKAAA